MHIPIYLKVTDSSIDLRVRPKGGCQPRTHWQSDKRQRTLSLSERAWSLTGLLADENNSNRSEVIEILVRYAALHAVDLAEARIEVLKEESV